MRQDKRNRSKTGVKGTTGYKNKSFDRQGPRCIAWYSLIKYSADCLHSTELDILQASCCVSHAVGLPDYPRRIGATDPRNEML